MNDPIRFVLLVFGGLYAAFILFIVALLVFWTLVGLVVRVWGAVRRRFF